jgi:hypothetical protein
MGFQNLISNSNLYRYVKGNSDNQFKSLVGALALRLNKQDEETKALMKEIVDLKRTIASKP